MFFSNQQAPPDLWGLKVWDLYGFVFFVFFRSSFALAAANTCSVPKPKLGRAAHHKKAAIYTNSLAMLSLLSHSFHCTHPAIWKKRVYMVRSVWFVEQDDYKNPTCDHRSWTTSPLRSVQESYNTQAIPLANYESKKSPTGPTVHRPRKNLSTYIIALQYQLTKKGHLVRSQFLLEWKESLYIPLVHKQKMVL